MTFYRSRKGLKVTGRDLIEGGGEGGSGDEGGSGGEGGSGAFILGVYVT